MIPKRGKNEFTTAGEPRTRGDDPTHRIDKLEEIK